MWNHNLQFYLLDWLNVYSHDRIDVVKIKLKFTENNSIIVRTVLIDSVLYRHLAIETHTAAYFYAREKTCLMVEQVGGAIRGCRLKAEGLTK